MRLRVLRIYATAMALVVAIIGAILVARGYDYALLIPTAVMAVAALISEKQTVRMGPHFELSVTFLPALFTAVVLDPLSAMIVALASLLGDLGKPWERWIIWSSSRCLILGSASIAAASVSSTATLGGLFAAASIASLCVVCGESLIGAITVAIRQVCNPFAHFRETAKLMSIGMLVYVPVIAGLAYVYQLASLWAVVLFVGPAIAAQRYFVLFREQMQLAKDLFASVAQLERVNLSFATALVTALDARDHYTAGHSAAVAVYARDIAQSIQLSDEETRHAHLCGLLHDIGKIGVPTGVLEKRGPLVANERSVIESHSEVGASILGRVEGYEEIAIAVRHHHERYDGNGYPDGIKGDDIPILARVVAVADAYSAMTSERPYRIALSTEDARGRIECESGTQFDPSIVEAFVTVLDNADEGYILGSNRDFEAEMAQLVKTTTSSIAVY